MLTLSDISGILRLLEKFLTFGRSEITDVQSETEELIDDLSRSLLSLYDMVSEVTRLDNEQFSQASFEKVRSYFDRFLSSARRHRQSTHTL